MVIAINQTVHRISSYRYIIVLFGLMFNSYFTLVFAAGERPPAPVVIAEVEKRSLAPLVWVAGSVISRNDAQIASEVTGRLVWIAEVGDRVRKGDRIARLDNALVKLDVVELEGDVKQIQARVRFYVQEVLRLQRLARQNNAAKTQLEETIADRDEKKGEVITINARLQQAKIRLERSEVKAPFAGIVSERIVVPGEWVNMGDAVLRIVNPKTIEIEAQLPLETREFIKVGSVLTVTQRDTVVPGIIRALVPVGISASRLMTVRLKVDGVNWLVGGTVRVAVPTGVSRTVSAVPRDALVLRRSGTVVFKVNENNIAERVSVITGIASGAFIEISGNINVGEKVIVRGGERMRAGSKVKVIPKFIKADK